MSHEAEHLTNGELHAWLDGALEQLGGVRAGEVREHLRACAACREALVGEERVRTHAAEVLALAVPSVAEAPPFELIVERARGRDEAPPVRRASRLARLGWAASVVIALGAGWTARELGLHARMGEPAATRSDPGSGAEGVAAAGDMANVAERDAPSGGRLDERGAIAEERVAEAPAVRNAADVAANEAANVGAPGIGERPAPARMEQPAARAGVAASEQRQASAPSGGRAEESAVPLDQLLVGPVAVAVASGPEFALGETPGLRTPLVPATTSAPSARAASSLEPGRATQVRAEEAGFTGTPARRAILTRRARTGSSLALSSAAPTSAPQPFAGSADVGTSMRAGDVDVTAADPDEALDLTVPGLDVLRVEWSAVAPRQPGLRVLQRLESGDTLEIRFVRFPIGDTDTDPLAILTSTPLRAGWSQVVRVHGDGWLVARARLAREDLEALVARAGARR